MWKSFWGARERGEKCTSKRKSSIRPTENEVQERTLLTVSWKMYTRHVINAWTKSAQMITQTKSKKG
jgi:hypothetical protein